MADAGPQAVRERRVDARAGRRTPHVGRFRFPPADAGRFPPLAGRPVRGHRGLEQELGAASFADFSQVVPKRRKELGDSPNLAPWLEFRMFIGEVLGDHYMRAPAQWAAEISPDLAVCEWGIYEPSVTWPVDWRRYAAAYKVTTRYGGNQGVLEELFRSFAPRTRHGLWMGYGMMSADAGRRIDPWRSLLNGGVFRTSGRCAIRAR